MLTLTLVKILNLLRSYTRNSCMRIQLRRLTDKDRFSLTSIIDKDTAELAHISWPFTKDVAETFINDYNTWGIWLNGSILAGAVEVKEEDCETAYFVHKNYRNIGIATCAAQLIMELLADKQLFALINPDNKASLRVAQKAGMRVKFID